MLLIFINKVLKYIFFLITWKLKLKTKDQSQKYFWKKINENTKEVFICFAFCLFQKFRQCLILFYIKNSMIKFFSLKKKHFIRFFVFFQSIEFYMNILNSFGSLLLLLVVKIFEIDVIKFRVWIPVFLIFSSLIKWQACLSIFECIYDFLLDNISLYIENYFLKSKCKWMKFNYYCKKWSKS